MSTYHWNIDMGNGPLDFTYKTKNEAIEWAMAEINRAYFEEYGSSERPDGGGRQDFWILQQVFDADDNPETVYSEHCWGDAFGNSGEYMTKQATLCHRLQKAKTDLSIFKTAHMTALPQNIADRVSDLITDIAFYCTQQEALLVNEPKELT